MLVPRQDPTGMLPFRGPSPSLSPYGCRSVFCGLYRSVASRMCFCSGSRADAFAGAIGWQPIERQEGIKFGNIVVVCLMLCICLLFESACFHYELC